MRNLEKDEIEMAQKRARMLAVGFRIFSEKTIEVATIKEIAKTCGLGYKTMFRYFGTKTALVIAIGEKIWKEYAVKVEEMYRVRFSRRQPYFRCANSRKGTEAICRWIPMRHTQTARRRI